MFFTTVWLYGAFALVVLGMASRHAALTVLGTVLLLTAGVSWLWNRWSLHAVTYQRKPDATRIFRGETVTLRLELVNLKLLPLAWIEVEDSYPDRFTIVDRRSTVAETPGRRVLPYLTSMRPYERVAWTATLHCPQRGVYSFGPTTLRSGDIFGFYRCQLTIDQRDALIVYPRVVPLAELGLPPRGPFGEARTRRSVILDPLRTIGTRDYHPEDSFRHIHWKTTARAGELQVRVFEPTTVLQLGIFLNLDTPQQVWRALDSAEFETIVTVAASLAAHALRERNAAGVYSNRLIVGSNQPLRVAPAIGVVQLTKVLESLAKLSPFATTDFARYLRGETLAFPWGSTIVVVTATMTPALAATLETLSYSRHRLVLLATEPIEAPTVRGLIVHQFSSDTIECQSAGEVAGESDGVGHPTRQWVEQAISGGANDG